MSAQKPKPPDGIMKIGAGRTRNRETQGWEDEGLKGPQNTGNSKKKGTPKDALSDGHSKRGGK